ncbi:hypothetical protein V1512DRAFT_255953 [Lipomyces arxii]|uniref:uncharacterized protein n=1 Tax=Lipomyces arxii TaxID=56418 RepID=UPI0034CE73DA
MQHYYLRNEYHPDNVTSASQSTSALSPFLTAFTGVEYLASPTSLFSTAAAPSTFEYPLQPRTIRTGTVQPVAGASNTQQTTKNNDRVITQIPEVSSATSTRVRVFTPGHRRRASVPRSRNGCWTCRLRRKKCPEERPACSACIRLSLTCDGYGVRPEFMKSPQAMDSMRQTIRQNIRAYKTRQGSFDSSAEARSQTRNLSQSSMREDIQELSSVTSLSPPADIRFMQSARLQALPRFLDIDIVSLQIQPTTLSLLSLYVHEVPSSVLDESMDPPTQIFLALIYFRMTARLLFPALFLQADDNVDVKLIMYDCVIRDKWLWRSVCDLASVYRSVVEQKHARLENLSFLQSVQARIDSEVDIVMATPRQSLSEQHLATTMFLIWNVLTLNRLIGLIDTSSLQKLSRLVSHLSLLSARSPISHPIVRIVVAHAMYTDLVLASMSTHPQILAGIYSDMLTAHLHGSPIFKTGAGTDVPVVTYLLLLLSKAISLNHEQEKSTKSVLELESVLCALDGFVLDPDAEKSTTERCSQMFRLAVIVYLSCSMGQGTHAQIRQSKKVQDCVAQFCELVAKNFLSHSQANMDADMSDSMCQQELERTMAWSLIVVGAVTLPDAKIVTMLSGKPTELSCRIVLQSVFDRCVYLREFGGWNRTWTVIRTTWTEPRWSNSSSWADRVCDSLALL